MDCTTAPISAKPARNSLLNRLLSTHALWQQRRHLATLDDAALCDMGLTHADVRAEIARPIWNAPDQWLR